MTSEHMDRRSVGTNNHFDKQTSNNKTLLTNELNEKNKNIYGNFSPFYVWFHSRYFIFVGFVLCSSCRFGAFFSCFVVSNSEYTFMLFRDIYHLI